MSSLPTQKSASELADELTELQQQILSTVQLFKESNNPTKLLADLISRPKFGLLAFAVGGLALCFLGYQVWRKLKAPKSAAKLPRKLQKQLPLLQEALNLSSSSAAKSSKSKKQLAQSAGKSVGQLIWKAATPVLIQALRKQLGSWLQKQK